MKHINQNILLTTLPMQAYVCKPIGYDVNIQFLMNRDRRRLIRSLHKIRIQFARVDHKFGDFDFNLI